MLDLLICNRSASSCCVSFRPLRKILILLPTDIGILFIATASFISYVNEKSAKKQIKRHKQAKNVSNIAQKQLTYFLKNFILLVSNGNVCSVSNKRRCSMVRKRLKSLRALHDLTQDEMATRCGVSRTVYGKIEQGKMKGSSDFWIKLKHEFCLAAEEAWRIEYEQE